MILLQPVLDCSKQRHSFLRTHSPLQKKYSSCKEIQKKESRKSLGYNKMSKKIENFSKLVQGALFETHRSQDQIVPSKTLRSESFLQMTHSSYELICTKALASRCLLLRSIVQIKNGFGCTRWNFIQPIPGRFLQRNSIVRTWLSLQRKRRSQNDHQYM